MKKLLLAVYTILSLTAYAQKSIVIDVDTPVTGNDTHLSFYVEIPQANIKETRKNWLQYVGHKSKGKSSDSYGTYLQQGVVNKNISAWPFEIQSRFVETKNSIRIVAAFSQNNKAFISQEISSNSNQAVRKYLYDFALLQYTDAVKEELKEEENKLSKLEKELAALYKAEEKSIKNINENERFANKANDAIATNKADIESANAKIIDQKDMVKHTSSDANATKGAQKTLGNLEDDKVALQKENEAYGKHMDAKDKEDRNSERKNVNTKQARELKLAEIEAQKQVVYDVKTRLATIK